MAGAGVFCQFLLQAHTTHRITLIFPFDSVVVYIKVGLQVELGFAGFDITMKNHCDGDIFEHSFRLQSQKLCSNISSITVIFHFYFEICIYSKTGSKNDDKSHISI